MTADTVFRRGDLARFAAAFAEAGTPGAVAIRRDPPPGPGRARVDVETGLATRISAVGESPFAHASLWGLGPELTSYLEDLGGPPFELLEAYLAETDYETQTAADGEETLQKVRSWRPDLILLDVMMPKISGFEVCKRLRADPATYDISVLMVTALDQPSDVERAIEAGTNDFLSKPINKTELLLRVRALLKSRHIENELDRALAYIESVEKGDS